MGDAQEVDAVLGQVRGQGDRVEVPHATAVVLGGGLSLTVLLSLEIALCFLEMLGPSRDYARRLYCV